MSRSLTMMLSILASILIIGSLTFITNIQNVEANENEDICGVYEPLIKDCQTIVQTNCLCEIIVTPDPEEG